MSDSQVTITLPMSEHAFGTALFILVALLLSAIIFGLLPREGRPSDPLEQLQSRMGLTGLPPVLVLLLAVIWAALFVTLLIGIFWVLYGIVDRAGAANTEEARDLRWSLLSLTAITAALGAVISLPFTLIRVALNRRQTETAEQGHITDRINTAVQGLGAEKTVKRQRSRKSGKLAYAKGEDGNPDYSQPLMEEVTQPNLEVRIGAIYALERIAHDSDRDHVQIMEILCAYIRQNAPAPQEDDWPELEVKEGEEGGPLEADWDERMEVFREAQEKAASALKPREDIQVALTVIGRREERQRRLEAGRGVEANVPFDMPCPEYDGPNNGHDSVAIEAYQKKIRAWKNALSHYTGYQLDLRNANLRGADLSHLNLNGARLSGTHLQGADLIETQLQSAQLDGAQLQAAHLMEAFMQGANLDWAQMQGASFGRAQMQGALLDGARMQGANLLMAQMQGASLFRAQMQGANCLETRLQGARLLGVRLQEALLDGARMQGANLWKARMQGADLRQARMDASTDLSTATLRGAALRSVDCSDIPHIFQHLAGLFGDASVTLPGGHGPEHESWPPHWPKRELEFGEFHTEWRRWQTNPDTYTPPE